MSKWDIRIPDDGNERVRGWLTADRAMDLLDGELAALIKEHLESQQESIKELQAQVKRAKKLGII